jgi:proline utilization trans-activator
MYIPPRGAVVYTDPRLQRRIDTTYQPLPSLDYAKSLVETMMRFVGNDYHFIMKKSFMARMEEFYRIASNDDSVFLCRLFGVFALGQLYEKGVTDQKFKGTIPGMEYFVQAVTLLQDLHEEANVEYIETLLILVSWISLLYMPLANNVIVILLVCVESEELGIYILGASTSAEPNTWTT